MEDKTVLILYSIKHVPRSTLTFTEYKFFKKSFNKIDIDLIVRVTVRKSFMICTLRSNADTWNFPTHESVLLCQAPQKTMQ